jgi:hypothetical protein
MQIQAKDLTLADVHRLLKLQRQLSGSFTSLRSLEALTEFELQELIQIRNDFEDEPILLQGAIFKVSRR